jgi:eukaryotic-like serine/threonine-protein kinase
MSQATLFARRYQPIDVLGQGGFGVVWRAFDQNLNREVALKLFNQGVPVFQAYYEAQLLVALESPYILSVFDASTYQDIPHITTAVAPLGSAEDRMTPFGVPVQTAVRWVRHLLVGLDVCHASGLIHRDIKPSNIFLQSNDLAQLGDFGVAGVVDSAGETDAHGDWRIRAPELYSSGRASVRSDVYSAGLCLYILLTGRYPFAGTLAEIEAKVTNGDFPRLRDVAPHVPQAVALRVERAMKVNPSERFETANSLHASLGQTAGTAYVWQRTAPHDGHSLCWAGEATSASVDMLVCVESVGQGFAYTTASATSGRRIKPLCGTASSSQLPIRLRQVFSTLQ